MPELPPTAPAATHDFERVAEYVPAVVFELEDGRPVFVRGACEELLGAPAEAYLGERRRWAEDAEPLHAVTTSHDDDDGIHRTYGVLVAAEPGRDGVTALPGRALLLDHLRLAAARARRTDGRVVVLHVGLDGLDLVSAALGRAAHEEVVREVARRIRAAVPDTALVAAPADGELAVMLADLDGAAAQVAEVVAGQVVVAARRPLEVDGEGFELIPRVGASILPDDAADAEALVVHAQTAMREARRSDTDRMLFYDGGTSEALERLLITARLRRAIDQDQLVLHFQPMLDLDHGAIAGVEALLRWEDPDRGLIPPPDFVPVAELTGLIEPIGRWVVAACCRQAAAWRDAGLTVPISFNVSPRQFRDPALIDVLEAGIAEFGLDPELFMVEITESVAMRDPACVEPALERLREVGVRLAIDDFGTGHSSLARLRDLEVDVLKIDRGFLVDAPDDERATRLLRAALDLAAALEMTAVAEGVETERQRTFLAEGGCTLAQGFHLARPQRAADVTELLRAQRA